MSKKNVTAVVKPHLDRAKSVQLPFSAHTSTNAKVGIFAAFSLAALAFTGVAALIGHKVASRVSPEYRDFSHKHLDKLGACCGGSCCVDGKCKHEESVVDKLKSDKSV